MAMIDSLYVTDTQNIFHDNGNNVCKFNTHIKVHVTVSEKGGQIQVSRCPNKAPLHALHIR
jgi:hypothetical protein